MESPDRRPVGALVVSGQVLIKFKPTKKDHDGGSHRWEPPPSRNGLNRRHTDDQFTGISRTVSPPVFGIVSISTPFLRLAFAFEMSTLFGNVNDRRKLP